MAPLTFGHGSAEDRQAMAWNVAGLVARLGPQFVVLLVLARWMTADDFGRLAALLAGASIMDPVARAGTYELVAIRLRDVDPKEAVADALRAALPIGLIASVGATVVLALLVPGVALGESALVCVPIWLMGTSRDASAAVFLSARRSRALAVIETTKGLAHGIVIIGFGWVSPDLRTVSLGIATWGVGAAVSQYIATVLAAHRDDEAESVEPGGVEGTVSVTRGAGLRIGLSKLSEAGYVSVDQLLLSLLVPVEVVGGYALAARVINGGSGALSAAIDSARASLIRHPDRQVMRATQRVGLALAVFGSLVTVVAALFAFPVFIGAGVVGDIATHAALGLMPVLAVRAITFPILAWMVGIGSISERARIQAGALVLNVLGNFVLIPVLGWQAAVLTTVTIEGGLLVILVQRSREK